MHLPATYHQHLHDHGERIRRAGAERLARTVRRSDAPPVPDADLGPSPRARLAILWASLPVTGAGTTGPERP